MLTTLVLAATMGAPATVAPVNFVHSYKEKDKLTYEMKLINEEMDMQADVVFDLTVGATKDDKTNVTIQFTKADMGGFGPTNDMSPIELVLDKNGFPLLNQVQPDNMPLALTLTTTYLPNKKLDVGESFEFERDNHGAPFTCKGKFAGMVDIDGTSYALLESEATIMPGDDHDATLVTKTYYNPATKRVERTSAVLTTPGIAFKMLLTLKKN